MEAGESKALNPFRGTILGTYWTIQCFHRMMEKKNYNHLWQVMVIQTLLTVYHLCKERKDKTRSSTKGSLCPSDIPRAHHANTHLMMSRPLQRRDLSFTTHTHVVQKKPPDFKKEHQDRLKWPRRSDLMVSSYCYINPFFWEINYMYRPAQQICPPAPKS